MFSSGKRSIRSTFAIIASTTLFLGVVGCSSDSSGSSEKTTNLTLSIWNPADKAGVQKAVDAFETANPEIKVTLEQIPEDQYYTKLDASLGAGEGPDVMWQSSRAAYYIDGGVLEPLDEFIKQDAIDLTGLYPEQLIDLYNFDDQQFGIPKDQDVWTWIYNTSVFENLGVTNLPTPDWTWDEMVNIAGELSEASGKPETWYGYILNGPIASVIHSLGGSVVVDNKGALDSAESVQGFEMVKALQDKNLIPRVSDSADFNAPASLISGQIAMARIPTWLMTLLSEADVPEGTFVAVPVPAINDKRATDTNGLAYTMNAHSKAKEESWELIKFLTSDEGAKLHAEGGAAQPANLSPEVKAAWFDKNSSITGLKETFEATLPDQFLRTTTQYPATRAIFAEIESTVTAPYFAGTITVQEAGNKANDLLAKQLGE